MNPPWMVQVTGKKLSMSPVWMPSLQGPTCRSLSGGDPGPARRQETVIFQGPPGTGKTYIAQALAETLAGSEHRVTLVQFHPDYAYEQFIQGYRPRSLPSGQITWESGTAPFCRPRNGLKKYPGWPTIW